MARTFWPPQRVALLGSACVFFVACSDPSGPARESCTALYLLAEHTDILARGRIVPVSAKVYRQDSTGVVPANDAKVSWASSNAAVLRVLGDTALQGIAAGSASLTVSACDLSQTFTVQILSEGYEITFLGSNTLGVALNDAGAVVGLDSPTATNGWLWQGGARTPIEGCRPIDVNNFSKVLCSAPGPTTWSAGVVTKHDTISRGSVILNDSGHVLIQGGAAVRWRAPGDYVPSGNFITVYGMNVRGDVVGRGGADLLYPDAYAWRVNGGMQGLQGFGRYSTAVDINASGVVVGSSEYMRGGGANQAVGLMWNVSGTSTTFREFQGPFPNGVAAGATGINDAGTVIGYGSRGGILWSQGRLGILSHMLADAQWQVLGAQKINATGQVLASVQNTVTGQKGAAILSPP